MIKQHQKFKITDEKELKVKIWRYIKFDRLEDMIKNEVLYFARSDTLGDKFEGSYSKPTIENRKIIIRTHLPKEAQLALEKIKFNNIYEETRKCVYVSSWHASEYESLAMWEIYAKRSKGLAIQTTIDSLLNSLKNDKDEFLVGFIKYINFDKDLIPVGNLFNPYFFKLKELEFEKEFRIATSKLLKLHSFLEVKTPKGLKIELDYKQMIDKIFIEAVLNLIKKYKLDCEVLTSKLDTEPQF